MSEASRAAALQHAAAVFHGSANTEAVLDAAEVFHTFIAGSGDQPAKVAGKVPDAQKPAKAKAPAKAAPEPDEDAVTKEQVGEAIEALLNADMRKQAVALFAKFGAKSLSGIKPEDYGLIKQAADDLLMSA